MTTMTNPDTLRILHGETGEQLGTLSRDHGTEADYRRAIVAVGGTPETAYIRFDRDFYEGAIISADDDRVLGVLVPFAAT